MTWAEISSNDVGRAYEKVFNGTQHRRFPLFTKNVEGGQNDLQAAAKSGCTQAALAADASFEFTLPFYVRLA